MNLAALQPPVQTADVPLNRLANDSQLSRRQKVDEVARQFESLLLRQILDEIQKPVIPSTYADNSTAAGIYRDVVAGQLAESISKSGTFGLAKSLEGQLNHQTHRCQPAGPAPSPGQNTIHTAPAAPLSHERTAATSD